MAFEFDPSYIDKSLTVAVGRQLYGLLSYQLSYGDLPKGSRLPSVRRMAIDLGIAQGTVAQVYQDLRDAGLLEMRKGSGAYTCLQVPQQPHHDATALRTEVEILLGKAERLGITRIALMSMVNAQAQLRLSRPGLRIIFVAVFEGPGVDYVNLIRHVLAPNDRISIITYENLREDEAARKDCEKADLVLTFLNRETELSAIVPDARIFGLRFIPSNETRRALASIDPRARVAAITQLKDYIAVMRPSIHRFAPHVLNIQVSWSYAPDLEALIAESDVVIYATGADHIARMVRPGVTCFEYRHAPDQAVLENELVPKLSELRQGLRSAKPVDQEASQHSGRQQNLHQQEMNS